MTNITFSISDERFAKLKEVASRLKLTPEELVQASIDDLLTQPEEDFARAMDYVIKKNTELYRRLA
ncbi:MAG: DNA-binding protein [Nitrospirota bacterium]